MKSSKLPKNDVEWYLPNGKKPFCYSSVVESIGLEQLMCEYDTIGGLWLDLDKYLLSSTQEYIVEYYYRELGWDFDPRKLFKEEEK